MHRLQRDARFVISMLIIGSLAGIVYAMVRDWTFSAASLLRGGTTGFFIALACAAIEFSIFQRFTRMAFVALLFSRTIAYGGVAMVTLYYLVYGRLFSAPVASPKNIAVTILITLGISFFANLLHSLRHILGKQAFVWLFTGRYSKPIEENRMFMLVDLVASTTIAENIGHVRYHQLVHKFWCDMTDAILDSKGDVYKYVGDQVIVTWLLRDASVDQRWFECIFAFRNQIRQQSNEYLRLFGIIPAFRTALHCGPVVTGEMGDYKREVGFIGDTINTAARILTICKDNQRELIVSEDVRQRTASREQFNFERIPDCALKGRKEKVILYAVEEKILASPQ